MVVDQLLKRIRNEQLWFTGSLCHYEGRTSKEIQEAVEFLKADWGSTDLFSLVHLWQGIDHDLGLATFYPERHPNIGSKYLGNTIPTWELGEISLVVGVWLLDTAQVAAEKNTITDQLAASLLLCDAVAAKYEWIGTRGLTRCRNPESKFVRMEAAVDALQLRQ